MYIFDRAISNIPLSLPGLQDKLNQSFEKIQYFSRVSDSEEI